MKTGNANLIMGILVFVYFSFSVYILWHQIRNIQEEKKVSENIEE